MDASLTQKCYHIQPQRLPTFPTCDASSNRFTHKNTSSWCCKEALREEGEMDKRLRALLKRLLATDKQCFFEAVAEVRVMIASPNIREHRENARQFAWEALERLADYPPAEEPNKEQRYLYLRTMVSMLQYLSEGDGRKIKENLKCKLLTSVARQRALYECQKDHSPNISLALHELQCALDLIEDDRPSSAKVAAFAAIASAVVQNIFDRNYVGVFLTVGTVLLLLRRCVPSWYTTLLGLRTRFYFLLQNDHTAKNKLSRDDWTDLWNKVHKVAQAESYRHKYFRIWSSYVQRQLNVVKCACGLQPSDDSEVLLIGCMDVMQAMLFTAPHTVKWTMTFAQKILKQEKTSLAWLKAEELVQLANNVANFVGHASSETRQLCLIERSSGYHRMDRKTTDFATLASYYCQLNMKSRELAGSESHTLDRNLGLFARRIRQAYARWRLFSDDQVLLECGHPARGITWETESTSCGTCKRVIELDWKMAAKLGSRQGLEMLLNKAEIQERAHEILSILVEWASNPMPVLKWLFEMGARVDHVYELVEHFPGYEKGIRATLLHLAARSCQSVEVLSFLIECGADVNAKDSNGQNALQWVVMFARPEQVREAAQILLSHGIDVNNASIHGDTAIMQLRPTGNVVSTDLMELLLMHQAKLHIRNTKGENALMRYVSSDNFVAIGKLLIPNMPGFDINQRLPCQEGKTLLSYLLKHSRTETLPCSNCGRHASGGCSQSLCDKVTYLIDLGGNVNAECDYGLTPVMYAAINQAEPSAVIRLLVTNGARLKRQLRGGAVDDMRTKHGDTILLLLSYYCPNPLPTMMFLKKSAVNINAINNSGHNALHLLFMSQNKRPFEAAKFLLDNGIRVVYGSNAPIQDTTFYNACQYSNHSQVKQVLELLLERIKDRSKFKIPALDLLAAHCPEPREPIKFLQDQGWDICTKDNKGRLRLKVFECLLENNLAHPQAIVSTLRELINMARSKNWRHWHMFFPSANGSSLLHKACMQKHVNRETLEAIVNEYQEALKDPEAKKQLVSLKEFVELPHPSCKTTAINFLAETISRYNKNVKCASEDNVSCFRRQRGMPMYVQDAQTSIQSASARMHQAWCFLNNCMKTSETDSTDQTKRSHAVYCVTNRQQNSNTCENWPIQYQRRAFSLPQRITKNSASGNRSPTAQKQCFRQGCIPYRRLGKAASFSEVTCSKGTYFDM